MATTIELRHLRYFVAVADERNFTRAATRVGIGQPPLSQQIRALEAELGVTLFRRLPHGVDLTEAGNALLPEARLLLTAAARLAGVARRAATGTAGRLRIGFTNSAAFHPIVAASIRDFRGESPDVELALTEANTSELLERLAENDVDAAFIRSGRKHPRGFAVQRLAAEATLVALPADHRDAGAAAIPLAALAHDNFLLAPRRGGPELFDDLIAACRRCGFEPAIAYEAAQISSIPNFVAAGLGVAIVPASIAALQVAGVRYVPILGDQPIIPLSIATRTGERSAVLTKFLDNVIA